MAEEKAFVWEELVAEMLGNDGQDAYLEQAQGELLPSESVLRITVTSNWAKQAIEGRHLPRIQQALQRRYPGIAYRVETVVETPHPADRATLDAMDSPTEIAPAAERPRVQRPRVIPSQDQSSGLNPRYTFERFVVGSSNRFAYAAALNVTESPDGSLVNPLFIYGGVGLGKTHLLHAIGNRIRAKHPESRVLYVSAETFTNDMVSAIRRQDTDMIRNKYRTMDVLLMDDIQFLQRKEQTQIEFFHTFNDLHNANKQIVLASDSNPQNMSELEERVKSRFMWGMVTSIDPPELETRIAILQRKAEALGIEVFPDDVAVYIAERITTNIRELEGTLSTVHQYAQLQSREVTIELVHEVLRPDDESDAGGLGEAVTSATIQRVVADYFRMKPSDLKSKRRTKRVATVRHIAMYLCRQLTDLSLVDIGRDFGGRDHSTVISACVKIEREMERDPRLAETVQQLIRRARGR